EAENTTDERVKGPDMPRLLCFFLLTAALGVTAADNTSSLTAADHKGTAHKSSAHHSHATHNAHAGHKKDGKAHQAHHKTGNHHKGHDFAHNPHFKNGAAHHGHSWKGKNWQGTTYHHYVYRGAWNGWSHQAFYCPLNATLYWSPGDGVW